MHAMHPPRTSQPTPKRAKGQLCNFRVHDDLNRWTTVLKSLNLQIGTPKEYPVYWGIVANAT